MSRFNVGTALFGAVCVATTVQSSAVAAQTYVPFTDYLPPLTVNAEEYESGYNAYCRDDDGRLNTYRCVDRVIAEMNRRYNSFHHTCDHRGIFALVYMITTHEYQNASLEPGFFQDTEFVNHEDTVFAQFYFHAADAWARGDMAHVPPAWRVAFASAQARNVSTLGDMLLGMSAHINRDLPIVLATIGLTDPMTGLSRKPDHDRVNEFLARVVVDPDVQASWDPNFTSGVPGVPTGAALVAAIQTWREMAWRHAELLVSATTPEQEAAVIAEIELYAYTQALAMQAATRYLPIVQSSASRDMYCNQRN